MSQPGISEYLAQRFMENLPYEPNDEQLQLLAELSHFCMMCGNDDLFLLNGYAGTGKTSMTGTLVKTLTEFNIKTVLLAPTGRAAKVFTEYSGHSAYTIHRKIYRQKSYSPDGGSGFLLSENKHKNTIFIVDEASMLPNSSSEGAIFGTGRLLDDLIEYVYAGEGCKMIILGDIAQLPPVGFDESPALSIEQLKCYGLNLHVFSLTKIARQSEDSGILYNATMLRDEMAKPVLEKPTLNTGSFEDFRNLPNEYMVETISDCYDRDGIENSIIVTRSNKRATMFNMGIRNTILYREEDLVPGDRLLVAKNNYFWSEPYEEIDFIANGDMATVSRVISREERYGFKFAKVELYFADRDVELEAMINLTALFSDTPTLTRDQFNELYMNIMPELPHTRREQYKALKSHPYFNALQVKFAYAVTCHKAQGGQWKNVFVDMGFIPEEALTTRDFYRWLYTAVTRARNQIYILGNI